MVKIRVETLETFPKLIKYIARSGIEKLRHACHK